MRKRLAGGLLLFAPLLWGQLDSNSVTVTASNTAALQPDEILFQVHLTSPTTVSLNDVVAALQGTGITVANFTGIVPAGLTTVITGQAAAETWNFTLAVPLAKIKDTAAQLTALQQTIAKLNDGFQMSFSVEGTQTSTELQQSQPCVLADLLKNARTQAQNLASAAGFTLDVIQAMSSTVTTSISLQAQSLSSFLLGVGAAPCVVTVKFGLVRQ